MRDSRPRGILSPADRAYLRGEADLASDQSEYDARYRIRERVRHALVDFSLLFDRLSEADRRQVFSPASDERDRLTEGVVDAVAFLYLGAADCGPARDDLFAEGIRRAAERERGDEAGFCSVRLDVERTTSAQLERVLECVERGAYHELDEAELRALACLLHRRDGDSSELLGRLRGAIDEEAAGAGEGDDDDADGDGRSD